MDTIVSQNLNHITKILKNPEKLKLMNQTNAEFENGFKSINIVEPDANFLKTLEKKFTYPLI